MTLLMPELIAANAVRAPARVATADGGSLVTYRLLAERSGAAAAVLRMRGVRRGERVAIWMEDGDDAVLALLGVLAAGAVAVPLDARARWDDLTAAMAQAGCACLIAPACAQARLDAEGAPRPPATRFESQAWREQVWRATPCEPAALRADDPAIRLAGRSLTHGELADGACMVARTLGYRRDDRVLMPCPPASAFAVSQLLATLAAGARALLCSSPLARDALLEATGRHATVLAADGSMLDRLARLHWPVCPSLRRIVSNGGSLADGTLDALRSQVPDARIYVSGGLPKIRRADVAPGVFA